MVKFLELMNKLENSEIFKKFKKEEKNTFLSAGFFLLNFKQQLFEYNLDYRNDKNIFTFKIPLIENKEIIFSKESILDSKQKLGSINEKIKLSLDIEDLQEKVKEELIKNKVINTLNEIIAVLQENENKLIWNLTCLCENFVIIQIKFDAIKSNLLSFEKKSLFEFAGLKKLK